MTEKSFEEKIGNVEKEMADRREQMEMARKRLINAMVPFLQSYVEEKVESHVKRQAEQTKSLGEAKLSELKNAVGELKNKMPDIVAEIFDDEQYWWSEPTKGDGGYYYSKLDKPIRLAAGHLKPILLEYGYLTEDDWLEYSDSGHLIRSGRPCAPYVPSWSEEMTSADTRYLALVTECSKLIYTLTELKQKQADAEAADLWDKA